LNDLLKLRTERRKTEIGFESQQNREPAQAEEHARKQAGEQRTKELHKWKVLLAEAKVDQVLLSSANRQATGHTLPANPEPILATQNAA